VSDGANYAVPSAVDRAGNAFVLWQQVRSGRLMVSIAPAGRSFAQPVNLAPLAGAKLWDLVASRAGPVIVEWVKRHPGSKRMGLYAATIGVDGHLAGMRLLASGVVGQQSVATDDRGDLAVMWADANDNPPTFLTLCPVGHDCRTERVPVNPMFGTVALLPTGTALVAGAVNILGDGVTVATCRTSVPCRKAQVLAHTGLFPQIVVDGAGRATAAWQDEQTGDAFLSSAVLPPGAERFEPVTKAHVRVGGLVFALATDAAGSVLAGWLPDRPIGVPTVITSFAGPGKRLRSTASLSVRHPGHVVTDMSDPSTGFDQHGNAVMAWSSAGFAATVVNVVLGQPPSG
jgi:hypothetical protein